MSTSKNHEDGDKKPPDREIKGYDALRRMREATPDWIPLTSSSDSRNSLEPTRAGIDRKNDVVPEKPAKKKVVKNEKLRITFWDCILKGISFKQAKEINAQLTERQPSSGSGTANQGSTTSDNNQSTKTRPREKSRGQNKKLWLESFRSWLRRRKGMATTAPAGGSGTGGTGAPGTPAPAGGTATAPPATAPAGTPAARTKATAAAAGTAATSSASPASSSVPATTTSSARSLWDPVWILGLVGIVAIVVVIGALITIVGFYCFRDQNVVSEFKEAERLRKQVAEEQLTYEKRRAEAEVNAAKIRAQGGDITRDPPKINIIYNIQTTNPPSGTTRTEATNQPPQQVAPITIVVTNTINVTPSGAPTVIQVPIRQRYYWDDPPRWSHTYIFVP